jgi:hypothetical protein
MLTRVFLAAGVAALAISAPANAGPGGGHGNRGGGGGPHGGGPPQAAQGGGGHGNGGGGPHRGDGAPAAAPAGGRGNGGGRGGGGAPVFVGGGAGRGHGGGFAAPRMQVQHQQIRSAQRQQSRGFAQRQGGFARPQGHAFARQQTRGVERQQARSFGRQQAHGFAQQQSRGFARQQARMVGGQQLRGNRAQQQAIANQQIAPQQFGGGGTRDQQAQFVGRQAGQQNFAGSAYSTLSYGNNVGVLPFNQAGRFVGARVDGIAGLSPLPGDIQYLYPDTADYYYRYGDGYLYQVDRIDNLIAALIPLIAGGYLPGQYLPAVYMDSYVPDYYGYDAFYPDYGDVCNRYYYGVIYQVDCATGYVDNVIPAYAGGYGVGQILPSAYSYYNVPYQYRNYYYNTADYGYWYAPGAIYQYDPRSSIITSVAALLSPGFSIGQPLPVGYDVYNVPYAYRATYYDTPTAWYRYSNGYIYQVDPTTQLVTAIAASLLT